MSGSIRRWPPRAAWSYDTAYQAFAGEQYAETRALVSEALRLFPNDELVPKFMLLDAMATGALAGEMAYKAKLDSLVARYPSTEEGKRAAEINRLPQKRDACNKNCRGYAHCCRTV
ncbi:MAG: hypothetical protein MZV63_48115 [Marinilabiliales bacterium]|nr:hypothetical protein [Marinilabiliales bacterium]